MARKSKDAVVRQGRVYSGAGLREIAFPLGGIGTGTVSLTGTGGLAEWQIKNRPDQDSVNPLTFFAIWARKEDQAPVTRVLEGPVAPPYGRHQRAVGGNFHVGHGLGNAGVPGLPRMKGTTFRGEYPFADVDYEDDRLPVKVGLEAYNPLVPMNPDDSGIPCAIFNFRVTNPARKKSVELTLAMSMQNPVDPTDRGGCKNTFFRDKGVAGIVLANSRRSKSDPKNGSVCIATPMRRLTYRSAWNRLGWFDALQHFWDDFSAKGRLSENSYRSGGPRDRDVATLGVRVKLGPGETKVVPIWVTWSFPVFERYWRAGEEDRQRPTWRNYYARRFPNARAVVTYLKGNVERLHAETAAYRDALFSTTLPEEVIDAVSSQISILRSPTCLRLQDGTFYGFEGSSRTAGSCIGSCTHVWNYAQALPFLFPSLARSVREADYKWNFSPSGSGAMRFRIEIPFEPPGGIPKPAADGQLGGIVRTYREYLVCGDKRWLRKLWPGVKQALEFAWLYWDYRKRGVPDGLQHNTYDIEFFGPNTLVGSLYLAALKAGERMAEELGEPETAAEYRRIREKGARWMDRHLFNGEYYVQKVDYDAYKHCEYKYPKPVRAVPAMKPGEPKYQYGRGCLADQLIGQWMAHLTGLGCLFDPDNVRRATESIFRYNYLSDLREHATCQRVYALQDEAGVLLCTWPKGGRPPLPFPYCDEVWTGIEYEVAALLIYEGFLKEGLRIVKSVRARHDGARRNPWNEFECGSYYARAMSSYSLLLALGGFRFDGAKQVVGFAPKVNAGRFRTFWAVQKGWGVYRQDRTTRRLEVQYGSLKLRELAVAVKGPDVQATLNGKALEATVADASVVFGQALALKAGDVLEVR